MRTMRRWRRGDGSVQEVDVMGRNGSQVPPELVPTTPVFLMATAGLRLVGEVNRRRSSAPAPSRSSPWIWCTHVASHVRIRMRRSSEHSIEVVACSQLCRKLRIARPTPHSIHPDLKGDGATRARRLRRTRFSLRYAPSSARRASCSSVSGRRFSMGRSSGDWHLLRYAERRSLPSSRVALIHCVNSKRSLFPRGGGSRVTKPQSLYVHMRSRAVWSPGGCCRAPADQASHSSCASVHGTCVAPCSRKLRLLRHNRRACFMMSSNARGGLGRATG